MTVIEAQEVLLTWFLEHDTFDPQQDFANIVEKTSLTRLVDVAIYRAALDQLTAQGVLVEIVLDPEIAEASKQWVLSKPLDMRDQVVEMPFALCKAISNVINGYHKALGGEGVAVESFTISSGNIGQLLSIIQHLDSQLKK